MSFEQTVRVPLERVGVVIGKEGSTKRSLEEDLGVKLGIDSREGVVTIRSDSIELGNPFIARNVVEAIGRGFSPQRAKLLRNEGISFEVVDLRSLAGRSPNSLDRVKGRIIGLKGKSRRVIEELTHCHLSIYGRTVAIIGEATDVRLASEAIRKLASGSQHRTVYKELQTARTTRKMERMILWEGSSPESISDRLGQED